MDKSTPRWNSFTTLPHPWLQAFLEKTYAVDPPVMDGPTLYLASDYGGVAKKSRYSVIGLVAVDIENSKPWELLRRMVRERYLHDKRRMAFKDLNDSRRWQALIPFLEASDCLTGICVAIAIDKRIRHLCSSAEVLQGLVRTQHLVGKWTPSSFETMMRVVTFISVFIAGLCKPGQNVYWITDHDDFTATPQRMEDTRRMLGIFTGMFVNWQLGELGFGTTQLDEGDRFEEDLVSIPDLVAGSVAETITALLSRYGTMGNIDLLVPKVASKAETIMDWFCESGMPLKRIGYVFQQHPGGKFNLGTWKIEETHVV